MSIVLGYVLREGLPVLYPLRRDIVIPLGYATIQNSLLNYWAKSMETCGRHLVALLRTSKMFFLDYHVHTERRQRGKRLQFHVFKCAFLMYCWASEGGSSPEQQVPASSPMIRAFAYDT